ncbi:MAG: hypothetical protein HYZ10_04895 [Ignavibacteriales bacterium]|nr:hypothetical protein [Ignavibacteriales bacterium]OGU82073.1 MAG: hypothetical protein A2279_03685 [Stygiobacter sp. RIFOXYA12_FULL_38_9]OGV09557.1 MAG: hypothetical protein A2299_19375 [Stygiobacter sp. RIFOXYB2_FULL_37_11]OGV10613.1 MAG: hypothetical protein A2237_01560 [Stygiobacter sp. RIFOXYA2_FULL_38_8]OGV13917.1 MAG: hypothetical protein A2440_12240 [Stygiobacter sp. RIFOXYC2_FULL_38_25]OGV22196.1 MAG: hypothetical protein A2499_09275 [Stygiobacter sp. RIFOXYC12_FULL_38_8]OGV82637.1
MKDNKKMFQPDKNWSIEKGDYKRDDEATWTYQRNLNRKKNIKLVIMIILYAIGVTALTYFAISLT